MSLSSRICTTKRSYLAALPNPLSLNVAVGSQFDQNYVLQNEDGSLMSLVNKIFEFSIRADPIQTSAVPPLISVTSSTNTVNGGIVVDTVTSTVSVIVSATPMATLEQQLYYYTLWMDQGLPDATALVNGTMFAGNVSAP